MAKQQHNRRRGSMGVDDIERGNTGTGDQNSGDVRPEGKVDAHTGEMERHPMGKGRTAAKKR